MLRCKWNGLLALLFILVPEQLSFSRSDEHASGAGPIGFPQPSELIPEPVPLDVTASVYFPEASQTDSTPLITADGSRINPRNPKKHRWVALSRNLLKRWGGNINFGDTLLVKGISAELDGYYVVHDVINKRIKNRIDLLVGRKDKILGKWENVKIMPAGRSEIETFKRYAPTAAAW